MNEIFKIVYQSLKWMAKISGFSYREINIIVYYIIIPSIFIILIERILKTNYLKIGFSILIIISLLLIPDFNAFSSWLFDRSVDFLNWFDVIGLNYIQASVIICVVVPIIIFSGFVYWKKQFNSN